MASAESVGASLTASLSPSVPPGVLASPEWTCTTWVWGRAGQINFALASNASLHAVVQFADLNESLEYDWLKRTEKVLEPLKRGCERTFCSSAQEVAQMASQGSCSKRKGLFFLAGRVYLASL